jgi:NAD(P)-dependent dehydrogenase (short-subunit alcohol dehydrogenase family)
MSIFQPNLLRNKIALATGAGSGIGQRIAERFAEHGAKVMLVGRKQDKLDAAVAKIERHGGAAAAYAADVRDYGAIEAAVQKTRAELGRIDVIVCAAAGNFPAPASAMSPNGFKAVVDIDLLGTFNTCRAAFDHLNKPGASIINISATHAFTPLAWQAHVCAAKAGIDILTKVLALEWGPEGVRVNCITPGPTADTEGMRRLAPSDAAKRAIEQGVPLRRYGTKDELADLALFLASSAAGYITGSVYLCDGGSSLTRSPLPVSDFATARE